MRQRMSPGIFIEPDTSTKTDRLACGSEVEVKLEGEGPWSLPDGSTDVELIHTPGHTTGHVVLLYRPEHILFSGDHWGYSGREQCGSLFRWELSRSYGFC